MSVLLVVHLSLGGCAGPEEGPATGPTSTSAPTDTPPVVTDTDTDTDTATADTATVTTPPSPADWTCVGAACDWGCAGEPLVASTPGVFDLALTADCTVAVEAWGGGGGGGGRAWLRDGGGGGGGGTLIVDDGDVPWLVAGGGGGGGGGATGGSDPSDGGGGGAGGHAVDVLWFAAGTHLRLVVGGGGEAGCDGDAGAGGAPDGGGTTGGDGEASVFGGGGGGVAGTGDGGPSEYGGGGGGSGDTTFGGAGGADSSTGCNGFSAFGDDNTVACSVSHNGGGGGGGGGLGATVELGEHGQTAAGGGTGGAAASGGAGGGVAAGVPDGGDPGGGGAGSGGCAGGRGGDGSLTLTPSVDLGRTCPVDRIADCDGGCSESRWHADGVCDAVYDCAALQDDGGDCTAPLPALPLPAFLTAACPAELGESAFCTTTTVDDRAVVGLDTRSICPLPLLGGDRFDVANAAWPPPYRFVYGCERDLVTRFDLETGARRLSSAGCVWVTGHQGGLLVEDAARVRTWYATFDDVVAGNGAALALALGESVRVASDDAVVYGAAYITDQLYAADAATGAALPTVTLDDVLLIRGFDVVRGVAYVAEVSELMWFDAGSGALLGATPAFNLQGLDCAVR